MKILKIFGIVVGIHLFALILIFANPGCSSTTKPPPQPADTVARAEPAPSITVPPASAGTVTPTPVGDASAMSPLSAPPAVFNPDAPAVSAGGAPGVRFTPTRPNTPAASAVLTQPVENVTPATTYTVKSGDSLWTLQKKFHINLKEIAAANNLKISTPLHEGQKLIIPAKSGTPATTKSGSTAASSAATPAPAAAASRSETSAPKASSGEVTYTVKPGDTIEGIAKKFEVRAKDLAVHNNIPNPRNLRAGMVLSIPGWTPAGSGRSSGTTKSSSKSTPAPATAAPEPKPAPAPVIDTEAPAAAPAQAPASNVPVIRLDDTPAAPAPTPKQ